MGEKHYSIADVAKKINLEPHLIHHWEEELALDIPRNERGFRYYGKQEIELLRSVQKLRQKGFRIGAIKLIINDIKRIEALPADQLLELRDKLDVAMGINSLNEAIRFDQGTLTKKEPEKEVAPPSEPERKLEQFKAVLSEVVMQALQQNNVELSQRINYSVSDSVVREMEYLLRRKEEREEEHYRMLDQAITLFRESDREAAATTEKKGWFRR
ncbi:MAG: MerR family transcriptional regulator [Lachnospiraceae bacterium]|nr:MerR family transcriptional regulator [Lachnospiraceae bacterium]